MSDRKVALITGASSGIGRAVAIELADRGYALAVLARREAPLAQLASEIPIAFSRSCDVTDRAAVVSCFAELAAALGRLDIVFNNAGIGGRAVNFGDLDPDEWDSVLNTNLHGAYNVARCAFRQMRDQQPQGGRIINNGSISAQTPRPHSAAYAVSKHAIAGLTKSIALDGRRFSIACSQIDIGNAATEMTSGYTQGALQPDGRTVIEPTFDVRHAAEAVAYMAGLPLEANVASMTVLATTMPFQGRG